MDDVNLFTTDEDDCMASLNSINTNESHLYVKGHLYIKGSF